MSPVSIKKSITQLVEYGYLRREVITDPETKEVKARHLYISDDPLKNIVGLRSKNTVGLRSKTTVATVKNDRYISKDKKEEVNTSSEREKEKQLALIPDPPKPEPPPKEVKAKTVKTTVDPNFMPPQETIDEMKRMYPQQLTREVLILEHANFIDHYTATGDKCVEGVGWTAAWKKWMRKVGERKKNKKTSYGLVPPEEAMYMSPQELERAYNEGRLDIGC